MIRKKKIQKKKLIKDIVLNNEKKKILNDYIKFKKLYVNNQKALEKINSKIIEFLDFIKKPVDDFEETDLIDFFNYLSQKLNVGSLNIGKALIKNFVKWKFIDWSIRFRNLDKICRFQKVPNKYTPEMMLSKEDVEKLVQAENSLSWKVYFLILFYGGNRPIETCKIKWKDITFEDEGCFIKIYSDKNKKYFNKFVPENVSHKIKELQQMNDNNSEWLFPSRLSKKYGKPISEISSYMRLKRISKKVLKREINPYLFRHSAATLLYNDDSIKEDDAARQMGHSKNMKNVYTHLNDNELKRRARKIYIKEENLPPEKKHELELKVENSNKKIDTLLDYVKVTHHILIDGIIKLKEKSKTKEELEELNELENKLDMIRIVNLK